MVEDQGVIEDVIGRVCSMVEDVSLVEDEGVIDNVDMGVGEVADIVKYEDMSAEDGKDEDIR